MRRVSGDGYRGLSCGRVGLKQRKHLRLRISELIYPEYYSGVKTIEIEKEDREGLVESGWGVAFLGTRYITGKDDMSTGNTKEGGGFHEYTQYVDRA